MSVSSNTISRNIDDHIHCNNCFSSFCQYEKCGIIKCSNCSILMHPCKLEDHLMICTKVIAPCINSMFGCKRLLLRERISEHLRVCSASVVHCGMQWNRQLLNKAAKKRFKKIVKGFEPMKNCDFSDQDLDVISALQDQNEIRRAYRTKRSVRQLQRNYFTPVNPLLPLRILDETEEFLEVDSSDDELRKNELELKKKKSPFDGCYLCKLEPGFQHLHVLGCMSTQNVDETPSAESKNQLMESRPDFYQNYGLFVDRCAHFINAYHPKGFIYDWVREMHTFICGHVVRREEFSNHHLYHAHLQQLLDADACVRCPLWRDGCKFVTAKLKPTKGRIRFNDYLGIFVHEPVPMPLNPGDSKPIASSLLGWKLVLPYLDSASLKCLSATNSHHRHMVQNLCYDQTVVSIDWVRIQKNEQSVWIPAGYKRNFSSVQSSIEWIVVPASELSRHLASCPFNKVHKYEDERINLSEWHGMNFSDPESLKTRNNRLHLLS